MNVHLAETLGNRWIDGACVPSRPTLPDPAAVPCPPSFLFGYLPSGWRAAPLPGTFQSSSGDATIEVFGAHKPQPFTARPSATILVFRREAHIGAMGKANAVKVDLGGTCGTWYVVGKHVDERTVEHVASQLVPVR